MKAKLFSLFLLCVPFSVFGMTGIELKTACDVYANTQSATNLVRNDLGYYTTCSFYIQGVIDGAIVNGADFCVPEGVSTGQTALVIAEYLKNHPKDLHKHAAALAIVAIHDAWPCE